MEVREGAFGWPVFVKSRHAPMKTIGSRVYVKADDLPDVGDDVQVIAQEPVEWAFEYHCFVDWRGVRTLSSYALHGELETGLDLVARRFPSYAGMVSVPEFMGPLLAQQWMPESVHGVVIDAGCIEGRGMAVVEANPAWCSGIYGCDPALVLDVVAAACVRNVG